MMIFDTHCHLNSEELLPNIENVIKNAQEIGVNRFLVVGWNKESSFKAVELAEKYDFIYAAIGFHPSDIIGLSDKDFYETMELLKRPKVVALGEIGLDYHWEKEEKNQELQRFYFKKQILIANEAKKPIVVHNRDAFGDCLKILKETKPEFGGVMHCYSGSVESMREVINLGLMIGIGGTLTFTNAKTPKKVCEETPLEKIVVETDCPYLTPHPYRGQRNEPKYIKLVVDEICRIKGMEFDKVSSILYENSNKLFHV